MRPHLHLLGILQLVWGAIGLLLGVSMLLLAVGAIAIGVSSADERMAAGVTAGAFVVFAVALLAGGGVNVWAGRALRQHQPSGRIAVLTLGVLNLFVLPFGTALGIYAFWVLLHNESRDGLRDEELSACGRGDGERDTRGRDRKDRKRARSERRGGPVLQPRLGHRPPLLRHGAPQQVRALSRDAGDARVRSARAFCSCSACRFRSSDGFCRFSSSTDPRSLWLLLMFKAYQGERFKLPIAGDMAEERI